MALTMYTAAERPSMKERYPITPIDQYVRWRRADGQLLDPRMRVYERLGARVAGTLPPSLRVHPDLAPTTARA